MFLFVFPNLMVLFFFSNLCTVLFFVFFSNASNFRSSPVRSSQKLLTDSTIHHVYNTMIMYIMLKNISYEFSISTLPGDPLVVKHGWLQNPRAEWRFIARNIIYFYGPFSSEPCLMTPEGVLYDVL